MRAWILIVALAASLITPAPVLADHKPEQVYVLMANLYIQNDSSVIVAERIGLEAGDRYFRYGFIREIPTAYPDESGQEHRIRLIKAWVSLDGRLEHFRVEDTGHSIRLHIGRPEHPISPGTHLYNIAYRVYTPISFSAKTDNLLWDITGSRWPVPVRVVGAAVYIPGSENSSKLDLGGFTGPEGTRGHNWQIDHKCVGNPVFANIKPLRPGDRFVIMVKWPKSMVRRATPADMRAWWWHDNRLELIRAAWVVGAVLVIGACYAGWLIRRRHGRNTASAI